MPADTNIILQQPVYAVTAPQLLASLQPCNDCMCSDASSVVPLSAVCHDVICLLCCTCGQVRASAEQLRLITFDADGTLYADGAHMAQDNRMIKVSRCTLSILD